MACFGELLDLGACGQDKKGGGECADGFLFSLVLGAAACGLS
jgi:hypothetical protein